MNLATKFLFYMKIEDKGSYWKPPKLTTSLGAAHLRLSTTFNS